MKKSLLILLFLIPIIFLILGLVNMLVVKDTAQGIGFLIIALVSAILVFLFYLYSKKEENSMKKLKENNEFLELNIEKVEQADGVLDIVASIMKDNIKYSFSSSYLVNSDNLCEIIKSNMVNLNYSKIKAWVNLNEFKRFEYDIESFFNNLGINEEVELLGWGATNKPNGFNK